MARIRTCKPDFFRHEQLQELEKQHPGLRPMLVYEGLWTQADREGRFPWKPKTLALDILPFLQDTHGGTISMEAVMALLAAEGFILRYTVAGVEYGAVVEWHRHQLVSRDEPASEIPAPNGQVSNYIRPPNATVRTRIYQRDHYTCLYCERDLHTLTRLICLDHVIPAPAGGTNSELNLVTCCKVCAAKKGGRTPVEAGMPWPVGYGEKYVNGAPVASGHVDNLPVRAQSGGKPVDTDRGVDHPLTGGQQLPDKGRELGMGLGSEEKKGPPPRPIPPEIEAHMSAVFIDLPTNVKGEFYSVREGYVTDKEKLFPAVDVRQALRSMRSWLDDNRSERKTRVGMGRFINRWLTTCQDKGECRRAPGARAPATPEPGADRSRDVMASANAWASLETDLKLKLGKPSGDAKIDSAAFAAALSSIGGYETLRALSDIERRAIAPQFMRTYIAVLAKQGNEQLPSNATAPSR